MPTTLQFRRGTSTQNDAFTGALGEVTVDTTNDALRIHDNSTAGGFETVARQAKYADVAERYHADQVYEPGTVVSFGGEKEITQSTSDADKRVAGVLSTDPYAVMNSPHRQPEMLNEFHPPIALLGRVPTKVIGTVAKGDIMVTSTTAGHARAWTEDNNPPAGTIIGKSVEDKNTDGAGVIEVVVGRL
jgi:hypothetical protein